MTSTAAPFCWYELMTTDLAAARAFYGSVVGWEAADSGMPGIDYTLFSVAGGPVAGAMTIPAEAAARNVPPNWTGYVRVEDVDAHLPRLLAAGGALLRPAEDIPGVGRFAVVADPGGAVFCLFREIDGAAPALPAAGPCDPGRFSWHELHAADGEAAFGFYAALFGWREVEKLDMGPMGIYRLFATGTEGAVGGMMTKSPDCPTPFWLYYVGVEALDAALDRVKAGGGRLLLEPMEVPGGAFVAQCIDPQGAVFALVAPKR